MIRLFRLVHLPFWRRMPLQAVLPILGIAVGVAAIVAIDLGSGSTVSSFRHTMQKLDGNATDQVFPSTQPLQGQLAYELANVSGVVAAAPVVETMVLAGGEPLRVYGVDPFAESGVRQLGLEDLSEEEFDTNTLFVRFLGEPGALVVSAPFARRQNLKPGDRLTLAAGAHLREAFILATLPERAGDVEVPDNLALCDVSTAQELTGRTDVTRIDLVVEESNRSATLAELGRRIPDGNTLQRPGGRTAHLAGMLRALRTNLEALSYLALFVSLFLIYNAMLLAVLRRRAQIGLVRCLGATRRAVMGAWMVEAAIMGIVGTALGLALGLFGSRFALAGIAQTASDLYGYVQAEAVTLVPQTFLKASLVGIIASLATAFLPALEAARTIPAHTASRGEVEANAQRRSVRAWLLAIPFAVLAATCLLIPSDQAALGYVAAIAVAFAVALITPALGAIVLGRVQSPLTAFFGVVAGMATENIRGSLSRTGVAMAALTVALSMSIAMGTMVSSFRLEMLNWIADVVRADVYIGAATAEVDRMNARIDESIVQELANRENVVAVDTYRGQMARVGDVDTYVGGVHIDTYRSRARVNMVDGPSADVFLDRIEAGQAGISETLMRKSGLSPGDTFTMEAEGQPVTLQVAGVYRDYSSDRGVILLDRSTFERALGSRPPNGVALYLAEGVSARDEVDAIKRATAGRYALEVNSNRDLRDNAVVVFDRTFRIARSLEIIGIGVAAIGILAALLAMLMERRKEMAVLRAMGLTPRQLYAMLAAESALLATVAWVFALVAGSGLAWILLRVINLRSFGWSLPYHVPLDGWIANLGLSLLAAALATVIPILRSRNLPVAVALREE